MNARDILHYGHEKVEKTLADVPDSAWETTGACGTWSVKDIMSHLASYEELLLEVLGTFTGVKETPLLDSYRTEYKMFNDKAIAARQDKTSQEVVAQYHDFHEKVMECVEKISSEVLTKAGSIPWYGEQYSLDDFIVYTNYGHKREHCAQINTFKDTLSVSIATP